MKTSQRLLMVGESIFSDRQIGCRVCLNDMAFKRVPLISANARQLERDIRLNIPSDAWYAALMEACDMLDGNKIETRRAT